MAFQEYLGDAQGAFAEVEGLLGEIERGELAVTAEAEADLRNILSDLAAEVTYKTVDGVKLVSFAAAGTRAARRRAFRRIDQWEQRTLRAFRAANLPAFRQEGKVLAEMRTLQNAAVDTWTRLIRRLSNQDQFTPEQIAEAKALSKDTARLRKKFRGFNSFLGDITGDASAGKADNLIAVTNRAKRDAENFVDMWSRGAPLGGAGEVVEALDNRVKESTRTELLDFIRGFSFNRNDVKLSAVAHARGLFNSALIAIGQALGVNHYQFVVTSENRFSPAGIQANQVWKVRMGQVQSGFVTIPRMLEVAATLRGEDVADTEAEVVRRCKLSPRDVDAKLKRECLARMINATDNGPKWPEVFDRTNQDRVFKVDWAATLGIHHGSQEFYLPIPATLLTEARSFQRSTRAEVAA